VPFAADGSGQRLFVDQRPAGQGRVGRFDPEDSTRFGRWPDSIVDLLEEIARSMETGQPYDGQYRPLADGKGALY
jgi:cell wall assembly regulator SMI1